jgi:iron complex outermembrane receptor protein
MKKILFLFLLLLVKFSFAQQSITGTIKDSKDSLLEGVSVFIPELQTGTITDDKGNFSFNNLPKSTVAIQFTLVGYKSQVINVNTGTTQALTVSMEASATELEEVLVTASNTKLPDNTPFPANSISQEGIRKYSAPSLMGNLSYQPGIDKITIGNGIAKPVIRGLSFNRILLYSQGTRIENQQWDDHHDLGITDVGIENVEIVRGPAALIYGADALGGALIFVDEKPAAAGSTVSDLNFGFGSNTLALSGDIGVRHASKNGFFYGLRVGTTNATSYLQGEFEKVDENGVTKTESDEFAFNSKYFDATAKVNVGVSKKWGMSELSYSYTGQTIGIVEDESADAGTAKPVEEEKDEQRKRDFEAPNQEVKTNIISLENTFITGKSKVNVNLAYQLNDRKEFEPLPDGNKHPVDEEIGLMLNTVTYDLKWTSNAEKKIGLTVGSQGLFLNNENTGKEILVPDAKVSDIGGYGIVRYDMDNLNLLAGLRYDIRTIKAEGEEEEGGVEEDTFIVMNTADTIGRPEVEIEQDYAPVSFSLGASYHAGEHFTIKLNGATGFSAPNYAQLGTFGKHEGAYRFERGNAGLKVEQNLEGDLGLIYESRFITFNLAGYMNMINDYIYIESTGDTIVRITPDHRDTLPVYDYKQGDATLSGAEIGFDIHPSGLKWLDIGVTYAMTSGKFDKTVNGNDNLPYIPSNKLVGELKLMKEKLWKFNGAYFSVIASNYSDQGNLSYYEDLDSKAAEAKGYDFEGYTLLDFHLGAAFKMGKQKASFDIFCTNALNTGYFNQLSLIKYIGVRDMGRNIGVRLHIPICYSVK